MTACTGASVTLKALIFDFDGLILDTETPDFIVLSEQYLLMQESR